MIKFLTALLAAINKILALFDQQHWKQQGRQVQLTTPHEGGHATHPLFQQTPVIIIQA